MSCRAFTEGVGVTLGSMKLGAEIRSRRKALGLTLDDLAERSNLSPHYLSTLENDRRDPRLSTILAVAKVLRVSAAELLGPSVPQAAAQRIGPLFERLPPDAQEAVVVLAQMAVAAPGRKAARPRGKRG